MQTIHEAANAIRQKKITPVDLVEQCLANIDRWEEKVHAWVFVDRDGARAEAERLTAELERGQYRGPLHGIPIGVKDIFDVFDWPTAAGSKLWANSIARQDADVVRQLRQAGAIFLGKTVTTQFASFDPPVTRNPWNLEHTPGGSSSGSAVAVATGMCLGALGSQTGGSITRPASYCGVAGCKPSYGAVSCKGVVPLAPSMDHPGPIARCVTDLAILLQAMAGKRWSGAGNTGPGPETDFSRVCLSADRADTIEFGLARPRGLFHEVAESSVRVAMDEVCEVLSRTLSEQGGRIHDVCLPTSFAEVIPRHRRVMAVEAAIFHKTRLERHPEDYQPRIRELIEEGMRCPGVEAIECMEHKQRLTSELASQLFGAVLITPATTSPAPDSKTTGNPAFNSPWSYTGLATISLPTGQFVDGLPLAIQLVARFEADVFRAAAWCEMALGACALTPPLP
jgi:aspartyl-tRNA(Asn)/glutamyl-tRNA(Gln) amidotransferase subunit A